MTADAESAATPASGMPPVDEPLVSIITPFHNTADYLAECIESVLKQTYRNFEYILVDNCSTDGSGEIAERYARADSRIRFIRRPSLLTQVQNYNAALAEASGGSKYLKVVQADDWIFPACVEEMARIFAHSPSIGLVSSYWLKGDQLRGSGFPWDKEMLPGKEVVRLYLRAGLWVFGSPTAVMYGTALLRKGEPFYAEGRLHEDTDKCMEILEQWDFGFAHQVLSFSRADNESISTAVRSYQPRALDRYIAVRSYASKFLDEREARGLRRQSRAEYYETMAREALRLRRKAFWHYQQAGLRTIGESLSWPRLMLQAGLEILLAIGNPASKLAGVLRFARGRRSR